MSRYSPDERQALLKTARESIAHGLRRGGALRVDHGQFTQALQEKRASFVTLERRQELRGCIGTLDARQPLIQDVAQNAYNAAFQDPRFSPLTDDEAEDLHVHISVLTPPELLVVKSEHDLLAKIRPFVDGLILEEGFRRGTFLPAVWEDLPEPRDFLQHLKRKAGFAENYWSAALKIYRYTAESITE